MKHAVTFTFYGRTFSLQRDTTLAGDGIAGCIDVEKALVRVATTQRNEQLRDTILHELVEGAYHLEGCVYDCNYPSDKQLFIFDHSAHHHIVNNVRSAYDEIVRKLGPDQKKRGSK
mgnify:CR=1 FL=1